jgi:hypothetical protein
MPATYEPISTTTVSGTSTYSVTFSSIPSTYTDLVVVANSYWSNQDAVGLTFNGDTGANYSVTQLVSTSGDSITSDRQTAKNNIFVGRFGTNVADGTNTANPLTYGTVLINVLNYANTTTNKTALSKISNYSRPPYSTGITVGLWRSTAAITSLTITTDGVSYIMAGSTFTLYGIKAA